MGVKRETTRCLTTVLEYLLAVCCWALPPYVYWLTDGSGWSGNAAVAEKSADALPELAEDLSTSVQLHIATPFLNLLTKLGRNPERLQEAG